MLPFGDMRGEIILERVKQGNVRRVGFVPVASLVFVALGTAVDDVLVIVTATTGTGAMMVNRQHCASVVFGNTAVSAAAGVTLTGALAHFLHAAPPLGRCRLLAP